MAFVPQEWSVVIAGRWNLAILTPAGILRYVFGYTEDEDEEKGDEEKKYKELPVLVSVPLDGLNPYIVTSTDKNIVATADQNRLRIRAGESNSDVLSRAMEAGRRVLRDLPKTPVIAAGVNFDYHSHDLPKEARRLVESGADSDLGRLAPDITSRTFARGLPFGDGCLNLTLAYAPDGCSLKFNFHRVSPKFNELIDWLATPVHELKKMVDDVFDVLDLPLEEASDDPDSK
ncbi:hypothetical protein HQ576_06560 [bacterium]|nr:hypothetical protein [bacterium]